MCARAGDINAPSRKRFTLYSRLILSSDTGQYRTAASAARKRERGKMRALCARRLARYVRYPPNSSSAPSPLKATVVFILQSFDRNQTGKAPASALGSSE